MATLPSLLESSGFGNKDQGKRGAKSRGEKDERKWTGSINGKNPEVMGELLWASWIQDTGVCIKN